MTRIGRAKKTRMPHRYDANRKGSESEGPQAHPGPLHPENRDVPGAAVPSGQIEYSEYSSMYIASNVAAMD